jgi:hypothetical protein
VATAACLPEQSPRTERGLGQLEEMHGVILIPKLLRAWSLHPFALMPTSFWVTAGARGSWAWCERHRDPQGGIFDPSIWNMPASFR